MNIITLLMLNLPTFHVSTTDVQLLPFCLFFPATIPANSAYAKQIICETCPLHSQ